jgi:hypothetical protein
MKNIVRNSIGEIYSGNTMQHIVTFWNTEQLRNLEFFYSCTKKNSYQEIRYLSSINSYMIFHSLVKIHIDI